MSVMNPRVVRAAQRVLDSYEAERADLKTLTLAQLKELEHEMEHLRRNPDYTYRVGAEVVRAAAVMERESREQSIPRPQPLSPIEAERVAPNRNAA